MNDSLFKLDSTHFQTFFESAPASLIVLLPNPPDFTIVATSNVFLHFTDKKRSELIGKKFFQAFPADLNNKNSMSSLKAQDSFHQVLTLKLPDAIPFQIFNNSESKSNSCLTIITPVTNFKNEVQYLILKTENLLPHMHLNHQKLEDSNNRLQSILDTAYDAFIAMDSHGLVTDWNKQAEVTFGWSKQEAIGKTLDQTIIPAQYKEAHSAGLKRFIQTGENHIIGKRLELPALKKDGKEVLIELTVSAVQQGKEYVFGAFLKDISSRKELEQYREVQLDVTRILAESISTQEVFARSIHTLCEGLNWKWGAFWRYDPKDEKLFLAHQYLANSKELSDFENKSRSLRYAKGEGLPGRAWEKMKPFWTNDFSINPAYPRSSIAKQLGLHKGIAFPVIAGEQFLGVLEFLNDNFYESDSKLADMMMDTVARLGFFILKKEAEEQLRQSEERFSILVEGIKDYAIISLDKDGYVTSWNRGAQQIVGYQTNEIIGHHFSKLYPAHAIENHFPEKELEIAQTTGRFEDEGWRIKKDGTKFWANVIINPIYDRIGQLVGFSKVTRDMTERKIAEQKLSQLNEELEARVLERTKALQQALAAAEEASHAKSSFLANMSHEIRTPLGVVLGYSELLMDSKINPSDKENFMTTIKRNGEILSNVINDILDLSKVEIGKLEIEKMETPLSDILIDITSLLELKAKEKSIQLSVSFKDSIPKKIKTDPLRLRQILINIIGNAIKFTEHGSVEVKLMMIKTESASPKLAFVIKDTGQGISADQEKKLFQPFSQADISTRRRFGGTGLGLILSRHLAELLGGNVVLTESSLGKGSTFTITIDPGPLAEASNNAEDNPHPSRFINTMPLTTTRIDGVQILVADDSTDNQILVSRILNLAGAQVETVDNGQMAVDKVQQKKYDVVLMDLQMPIMDGYEATKQLRKAGYYLPIVALTAHALKEEREFCLKSGFDDHVSKPIDRNTLIDSIHRLVTVAQ